jgi:hypothetical protein
VRQLSCGRCPRAVLATVDVEQQAGVLGDGAPRKQRRRLRHEADPLLFPRHVGAGSVDRDAPGRRLVEAADETEQRGLAAPARAEDGDDLARAHREVDAGERLDRTEVLAHPGQLDGRGHGGERYRLSPRRWRP